MIWLTWRQHRAQVLVCVLGLAVLGVFLVVTGIGMASTFTDSGLAHCLATTPDGCPDLAGAWLNQYSGYQFAVPLFLFLPALLGVACGSPLVAREIEQGTHRMIWMQSVSRTRWLSVKLIVLGTMVVVASAAYTIALQWWSGPLVAANNNDRFAPGVFDLLGSVPVLYSLFAFALGVAAGAVIRRAIPAMGATLVTFTGVRVAVEFLLRPLYQPALTDTYSLAVKSQATRSSLPGTWLISAHTVDRSGDVVSNGIGVDYTRIVGDCPNLALPKGTLPSPADLQTCFRDAGVHVVATYQPAARYWMFQGIEFGALSVSRGRGGRGGFLVGAAPRRLTPPHERTRRIRLSQRTWMMATRRIPPGLSTVTSSPARWPEIAAPKGESSEIR